MTKRLAIEAGSPLGWHRYVGNGGDILGVERFGASAPEETLLREYGFTVEKSVGGHSLCWGLHTPGVLEGGYLMRVGIAADHGGFAMKERMKLALKSAGHLVTDFGALQLNPVDDYPDFVLPLAKAVVGGEVERGVAKNGQVC